MPDILIVEDNVELRKKIVAILSEAFPNVRIMEAGDANETRRIMKTERPVAAIVDIRIKGERGLELTRDIKHISPGTSVIINSNYEAVEYRQAAEQRGADHFLSKKTDPINNLIRLLGTITAGSSTGNPQAPDLSATEKRKNK